jgi:hypothetical protein
VQTESVCRSSGVPWGIPKLMVFTILESLLAWCSFLPCEKTSPHNFFTFLFLWVDIRGIKDIYLLRVELQNKFVLNVQRMYLSCHHPKNLKRIKLKLKKMTKTNKDRICPEKQQQLDEFCSPPYTCQIVFSIFLNTYNEKL